MYRVNRPLRGVLDGLIGVHRSCQQSIGAGYLSATRTGQSERRTANHYKCELVRSAGRSGGAVLALAARRYRARK